MDQSMPLFGMVVSWKKLHWQLGDSRARFLSSRTTCIIVVVSVQKILQSTYGAKTNSIM